MIRNSMLTSSSNRRTRWKRWNRRSTILLVYDNAESSKVHLWSRGSRLHGRHLWSMGSRLHGRHLWSMDSRLHGRHRPTTWHIGRACEIHCQQRYVVHQISGHGYRESWDSSGFEHGYVEVGQSAGCKASSEGTCSRLAFAFQQRTELATCKGPQGRRYPPRSYLVPVSQRNACSYSASTH